MAWKEVNVLIERFKFVMEVLREERPMSRVCEDYGISRQTGYKWINRYRENPSADSLKDESRTPHSCPKQLDYKMEDRIRSVRKKFPYWGPRKIRAYLVREEPKRAWPHASSMGRVLKRAGLVRPVRRRRRTPAYSKPFSEVVAPNQLWCIDFKGHFKVGSGIKVYPLTITDAYSRMLLRCEIVTEPKTLPVKEIFESAFKEFGLPVAIRSDNGAPFASTGVGGLSELSVWWTRLGIRHERIEPGKPQQNGRHERMHLTLKRETCSPPSRTVVGQQRYFDRFRKEFNEERPHEGIGNKRPIDLYVPSDEIYRPDFNRDYPLFGMDYSIVEQSGKIQFRKKKLKIGSALKGQTVDIKRITQHKWCFLFGSIVLGFYDEKKPTQELIRPKKSVSYVLSPKR